MPKVERSFDCVNEQSARTLRDIAKLTLFLLVYLLGTSVVAHAATPDLTGQWTLDIKRSDAWPANPPFTAAGKMAFVNFNRDKQDSAKFCMPFGMPRVMEALDAAPMEILHARTQITLIFESHDETRRIFMDGRKHPDELLPSWSGHSIGHWQGNTLIVDTTGMTDESLINERGFSHSEALHIIERIARIENGQTLKVEMTLIDSAVFTKAVTVTRFYRLTPGVMARENDCSERRWNQYLAAHIDRTSTENASVKK